MTPASSLVTALLVLGAIVSTESPGVPADPTSIAGTARDNVVELTGRGGGSGSSVNVSQPTPQYLFVRRPLVLCGSLEARAFASTMCLAESADLTVNRVCDDGSAALDPLFRRRVDPTTGAAAGLWEQVDNGGCPEDPPATVVLTVADFRRLPIAPSSPQMQPADGRGLVNMDLILWTDPGAQTMVTTVLGVPVTVRATPVRYAWDFGDGSPPLVTTQAGGPYPDRSVARSYDRSGSYALTLTTTWAGEYQVNGTGPWLPVLGTATTTSAPVATEAVEAHPRLVSGPQG